MLLLESNLESPYRSKLINLFPDTFNIFSSADWSSLRGFHKYHYNGGSAGKNENLTQAVIWNMFGSRHCRWDEKLGVDERVEKKIPYFKKNFLETIKKLDLMVAWGLAALKANLCRGSTKHSLFSFNVQNTFSWLLLIIYTSSAIFIYPLLKSLNRKNSKCKHYIHHIFIYCWNFWW